MELLIKESSEADIVSYAKILRNKDWLAIAGFSESEYVNNSQLLDYISCLNFGDSKKSILNRQSNEFLGFCHLKCEKYNNDTAEYFGGLKPELIGSGLGVRIAVAVIKIHFDNYPAISKIKCTILRQNHFSINLNLGIGFAKTSKQIINNSIYDVFELSKENFYKMPIVSHILNKYQIETKCNETVIYPDY